MLCLRVLTKNQSVKLIVPAITQLQTTHSLECTYKRQLHAVGPSINRVTTQRWSIGSCAYHKTPATGTGANVMGTEQHKEDMTKQTQAQTQEDGILKRVLNKVGFKPSSKARLKVASVMLYESVADKISYLEFFDKFNMPNTFNSWFLVTELHVWMLLVRSMAEGCETGEDGRMLRNCIVEAMWDDVNTRAKKLGAQNPSRTRQQIEILSEQFQAALIAYDEGIMSDDRVLAGSLWRRFFEMSCDDFERIERMVKYVRQQIVMLDRLPSESFLSKPKIPWIKLEKITI